MFFNTQRELEQNIWREDDDEYIPTNPVSLHSDYDLLKEEYNKLIETNHTLASQYEITKKQKEQLLSENNTLKQSLSECEKIIQQKMQNDNDTWTEMESVHYDLANQFKYAQTEIIHLKTLIKQQNQEIEQLHKELTCNNNNSTHQKEIRILQNELEKCEKIIDSQQLKINQLDKHLNYDNNFLQTKFGSFFIAKRLVLVFYSYNFRLKHITVRTAVCDYVTHFIDLFQTRSSGCSVP